MRIGTGRHTYEWIDNWAKVPDSESAQSGWAHTDVVVTQSGEIVTYHQGDPTVLVFDSDGDLLRSFDTRLTEGHGMTLVREGESERLWIADSGKKRDPALSYDYPDPPGKAQAVKMSLDGQTLMTLECPDIDVYQTGSFAATALAVYEERFGGNGDIWLADGYGESYVHRYDRSGTYVSSISGEEGSAGRFNCPHGIWIDTRKPDPELYVADRGNGQVQVYDLDGAFKRSFGSELFTTPSAFAAYGGDMIVAELEARLAVIDIDDRLVTYLGENTSVVDVDGWPNNLNEEGEPVRTRLLEPGKFNAPHGVATDGDGNIYVAEWGIGGRYEKLLKS